MWLEIESEYLYCWMYIHAVLSLSPLLQDGDTPLMKAAYQGREDTVKELLSSGASVHCTNKVKKIANFEVSN